MKLIKNMLVIAAMFTLLAVPFWQPMDAFLQLKYLTSLAVVGLLANYVLGCPFADLMAFLAFIFYRQSSDPYTLIIAGVLLALYHARVYLVALIMRVELGTTEVILFLLSTIYAYFLFFNWQMATAVPPTSFFQTIFFPTLFAKAVIAGKAPYVILEKTAPIFGGILLAEALILWYFARICQSKLLAVIYSLFTVAGTTSCIMLVKGFARVGILVLFGFCLQAAGRASAQLSLKILGWLVVAIATFLLLSKYVVFKIVVPHN